MKHIIEVDDRSIGIDQDRKPEYGNIRVAVRCVLFNDDGDVAIEYIARDNYYKLPGGGVDHGEDFLPALKRELLEEVGAKIVDIQCIGTTVDAMNKLDRYQVSHCYTAHVDCMYAPSLEQKEIDEGLQVLWVPPLKALSLMASSEISNYRGYFISKRDYAILQHAIKKTSK